MAAKRPFRVQRSKSKTKGTVPLRRSALVCLHEVQTERKTSEFSPTLDAQRLKQAYVWEYRNAQQVQAGEPSTYTPSSVFNERGTWHKQAQKLRELGIDPGHYVRVLMKELRNEVLFYDDGVAASRERKEQATKDVAAAAAKSKGAIKTVFVKLHNWSDMRPPTPAQLTCEKYLKMYRRAVECAVEQAELEFRLQNSAAKLEMSYQHEDGADDWDDAIVGTLHADYLELSPLFRYCAAMDQIVVPEKTSQQKRRNDRFRRIAGSYYKKACLQYCHNEVGYSQAWGKRIPPTLIREAMSVYEKQIGKITC